MRKGDRFDRYVIEALLGRGGMGEVYRAYDERLRRRVALKLLSSEGESVGPEAMLREARAAAALRHPNAVAVYDVAESGGRPYLTMELLEGRPLRSLVGAEGVPLGAKLRWLRQAATVLAEAHRLGLVHRDVKPDNMFVCNDGMLKLLDFGIAKQLQAESPLSARPAGPAVVGGVVSEIIGTPYYMAPEHRLGVRADGRSDQFAWGVVAFEVCTGRHPRELGDGRRDRFNEALAAQGLGPALVAVVLRAFSNAPEARFAAMTELITAWDSALLAEPHEVRPSAHVPVAGVSGPSPHGTPPGSDGPASPGARRGPGAQGTPPGVGAARVTPAGTEPMFRGTPGGAGQGPQGTPPGGAGQGPQGTPPGGLPQHHGTPGGAGQSQGMPAGAGAQGVGASNAAPRALGADGGSWSKWLRRSASDKELAVLLASLFVAVGLGATFFAIDRRGQSDARPGASASAPASGSAGARAASGPWECAFEGPELAIAEGVSEAWATSLLTVGDRVYAHAGVAGAGGGPPVSRGWRLLEGRFQPVDLARMPGFEETSPGTLVALEGGPAFFTHNGKVIGVSGIDPAPGAIAPRYAHRPGYDIEAHAFGDRGPMSAFVTVGYRAVQGARVPVGKIALVRPGCEPENLEFDAARVFLMPDASNTVRPAAPLVALGEGKAAVALLHNDMSASVLPLAFDMPCGPARFGEKTAVPAVFRAGIAYHRGELHWATIGGTHSLFVGGPEGRLAVLPAHMVSLPISFVSSGEMLALAWVEEARGADQARVVGFRPGEAPPAPLTLDEGKGVRDVLVRPLPDGAFVTWVKGGSMRGRALRCGARP